MGGGGRERGGGEGKGVGSGCDFTLTNDRFHNKVGLRRALCPEVQQDHHYAGAGSGERVQ